MPYYRVPTMCLGLQIISVNTHKKVTFISILQTTKLILRENVTMGTTSYHALSFSRLNLCYFQHNSIVIYSTTVETLAFAIIGVPSFHTTYF